MGTASPITSSGTNSEKWCFAGETAHEDCARLRLIERLVSRTLPFSARLLAGARLHQWHRSSGYNGTVNLAKAPSCLTASFSEYPASPQAKTVRDLISFLRDKQPTQDGPLTASEAQRLRALTDALASIKRNYRTATSEKRKAIEIILGADTFRDTDNSLGSLSNSGARLRDSLDKSASRAVIRFEVLGNYR